MRGCARQNCSPVASLGWSTDVSPTAALTTNALGMAIDQRRHSALGMFTPAEFEIQHQRTTTAA